MCLAESFRFASGRFNSWLGPTQKQKFHNLNLTFIPKFETKVQPERKTRSQFFVGWIRNKQIQFAFHYPWKSFEKSLLIYSFLFLFLNLSARTVQRKVLVAKLPETQNQLCCATGKINLWVFFGNLRFILEKKSLLKKLIIINWKSYGRVCYGGGWIQC